MSTDAVAIAGFVALFALMLLRVPVGMAMGLVGVCGFGYLTGFTPALKLVGQTSMRTVTDYTFGVIPMFLLMGTFVSNSGMSRELFRAANGFVGHLRGGLGIATVAACGGFAAICGSSVATAATITGVALPAPTTPDDKNRSNVPGTTRATYEPLLFEAIVTVSPAALRSDRVTASSAASASAQASPGPISQASTRGDVIPAARSARASSSSAVPSQVAPPATAARADGSSPWP